MIVLIFFQLREIAFLLWGIIGMDKDYFVEILLDTYCTITQMRINIAKALSNCLIALYFS